MAPRETPLENIFRWSIENQLEERLSHGYKLDRNSSSIVVVGPSLDVVWDGLDIAIGETIRILMIHVNCNGAALIPSSNFVTNRVHMSDHYKPLPSILRVSLRHPRYVLEDPAFPDNLIEDAEACMDQHYAMLESIKEEMRATHGRGYETTL